MNPAELFYDVIFAYALARSTAVLQADVATVFVFVRFFAVAVIILQSWMFVTQYLGRFGCTRWYEYLALAVNAVAMLFTANAASAVWGSMALVFNAAIAINLATLLALYALRWAEGDNARMHSWAALQIVSPALAVFVVAVIVCRIGSANAALWLDLLALAGIIALPFVIKADADPTVMDFPHLLARFEQLAVATLAGCLFLAQPFIAAFGFGAESLLLYGVVAALLAAYLIQMHNLVEHRQRNYALPLAYSQFLALICINLFTASLNMAAAQGYQSTLVLVLAAVGMAGFVLSLLANGRYYRADATFGAEDMAFFGALLLMGAFVVLADGQVMNFLLAGALITAAGSAALLLLKDKGLPSPERRQA